MTAIPLLLALWACDVQPPPETDLAGQTGTLGTPANAGKVEARAERIDRATSSRIVVERDGDEPFVVADRGDPDRVALSEGGTHVAWVSGQTGIASVWIAETRPGAPHRQLTNVGLEDRQRVPGQAPEGFVPPPHAGPLAFDGDALTWESPRGTERVIWR